MKKGVAITVLLVFGCLVSFKPKVLFSVPVGWPQPLYNFTKNPLTEKKVELGRKLFYDPILSRDSTISCSSCHLQYTAFTHVDHDLSHGIDGRIGIRNSPALMNLAWSKSLMWDGAVNHLDMLALAPISNKLEMDEEIGHVIFKLKQQKEYPVLFEKAFGTSITGETVLKALSQFLLTLVSADAKYDKVKRGEASFTEMEAKGYLLYRQHCSVCHTEPLFTNHGFANNGLAVDTTLNDFGLMVVTGVPTDSLLFKVPTLRNLKFSYPYMHDGRFKTLNQVLNHYSRGVQPSSTLHTSLQSKISLSGTEKTELTAFLMTLTDSSFLFNPRFSFPR